MDFTLKKLKFYFYAENIILHVRLLLEEELFLTSACFCKFKSLVFLNYRRYADYFSSILSILFSSFFFPLRNFLIFLI